MGQKSNIRDLASLKRTGRGSRGRYQRSANLDRGGLITGGYGSRQEHYCFIKGKGMNLSATVFLNIFSGWQSLYRRVRVKMVRF